MNTRSGGAPLNTEINTGTSSRKRKKSAVGKTSTDHAAQMDGNSEGKQYCVLSFD